MSKRLDYGDATRRPRLALIRVRTLAGTRAGRRRCPQPWRRWHQTLPNQIHDTATCSKVREPRCTRSGNRCQSNRISPFDRPAIQLRIYVCDRAKARVLSSFVYLDRRIDHARLDASCVQEDVTLPRVILAFRRSNKCRPRVFLSHAGARRIGLDRLASRTAASDTLSRPGQRASTTAVGTT